MSNLPAVVVSLNEMQTIANAVAKSGLFGMKTPEQALALMAISQAEGMHPALAVRDFHIIQGRPALKADAMLARFQQSGGTVKFTEYTDKRVAATFSHPQGGAIEVDWTMERAKQAGLGGKDNWKNYPRQMLRARVISEGIRTIFPGCVSGFYTPEEVQDFTATSAPMPPIQTAAANAPEVIEGEIVLPDTTALNADELIKVIEAQITDAEIKKVSAKYRKEFDALSKDDQTRVLAARKKHIATLQGAA